MTERIPDYPPRILEVHVTQGEDIVIDGLDLFALWEREAIANEVIRKLVPDEEDAHCEGCACEESTDSEERED